MTVRISFDASPGVNQWVINRKSGIATVADQQTAQTRNAAERKARRMADDGEPIILTGKRGGREVIRQGSRGSQGNSNGLLGGLF